MKDKYNQRYKLTKRGIAILKKLRKKTTTEGK